MLDFLEADVGDVLIDKNLLQVAPGSGNRFQIVHDIDSAVRQRRLQLPITDRGFSRSPLVRFAASVPIAGTMFSILLATDGRMVCGGTGWNTGKTRATLGGASRKCGLMTDMVIEALDWPAIERDLDACGCAVAPKLIAPEACRALAALFPDDRRFRATVVMARHGFGRGEYRYFADPLPGRVAALRRGLYPRLAPIADRWNETMGVDRRYPAEHDAFRAECRAAGQIRPTPLLLRYREGDYNCLHQDVYGALVFPLQAAILLSAPGRDFSGGEFVLTEQRPRMQSRAEVVSLGQGDGVIFAVRERPIQGTRGPYRVALRHGVSRIRGGERFTLGIIFHDAT